MSLLHQLADGFRNDAIGEKKGGKIRRLTDKFDY